jgi:hypothetical protein
MCKPAQPPVQRKSYPRFMFADFYRLYKLFNSLLASTSFSTTVLHTFRIPESRILSLSQSLPTWSMSAAQFLACTSLKHGVDARCKFNHHLMCTVIDTRSSLMFGAIGMSVSQLIVASVGTALPDNKTANQALIAFVCIYIFFFACSWGPCGMKGFVSRSTSTDVT